MKIIGLDGREYSWIPSNNTVEASRSKNHSRAYQLIRELFPNDRVLEELVLPGTKTLIRSGALRADFYIPMKRMLIEVHGTQHTVFNPFFYKNKMEFARAQTRDRDKKRWCDINEITLIELHENETIEEWKNKLWQRQIT